MYHIFGVSPLTNNFELIHAAVPDESISRLYDKYKKTSHFNQVSAFPVKSNSTEELKALLLKINDDLHELVIIDESVKFAGYCVTTYNPRLDQVEYSGEYKNGRMTNMLSWAQYVKANPDKKLKKISWAEFNKLVAEFNNDLITEPQPINEDRYEYMLGVMPPERWHSAGGWSVFHICERLTDNIVSWFAKRGDEYREFTDRDNISSADIAVKLNKGLVK